MDDTSLIPNEQIAPAFVKRQNNYQPNRFTESKQEFTELEKKIVILLINQIGYMAIKNDLKSLNSVVFNIPFSELTSSHYKQIADAAQSLQGRRLAYRNDENKEFDFFNPFPSVRTCLVDNRRMIEITILARMLPHFAELGQRYTKYDVEVMLSLNSVYSQRMFEIVSMFHNRGQHEFTYPVDKLMMMLNCPERCTYAELRRNALDVAQRELEAKANYILDWEPTKKIGKAVVELGFTVKSSKQVAAQSVEQEKQSVRQMSLPEAMAHGYQLMKSFKLAKWQQEIIISDPEKLNTFLRVESELANGLRANIKNPTAYLVKSLGMDQMKAPAKKAANVAKSVVSSPPLSILAAGPTVRTGSTQSIADLFGTIIGK